MPLTPLRVCYVYLEGMINMEAPVSEWSHQLFNKEVYAVLDLGQRNMAAYNITWVRETSIGELVDSSTLSYSGCIGSMQRNESDTAFSIAENRFYGDAIRPWTTFYYDLTEILTAYKKTGDENSTDVRVMEFLNGYPWTHWLLTSIAAVLLSLMLLRSIACSGDIQVNQKFGKVTQVVRRDTASVITGCVVNQHGNCGNVSFTANGNFIYTLMTLLAFFTWYFLTSMISTEMIALQAPATYENYKDILDQDVIPKWITMMNDHRYFKYAKDGTTEKKIWDRAVERGLNQSLVDVYDLFKQGPAGFVPLFNSIMNRESVLLANKVIVMGVVPNACAFARTSQIYPGTNSYTRIDDNSAQYLRMVLGSNYVNEGTKRLIIRKMSHKFQMHTYYQFLKDVKYFVVGNKITGSVADIEECVSNVIVMQDSEVIPVPAKHYADLAKLCIGLLLGALIVLVTEVGEHQVRLLLSLLSLTGWILLLVLASVTLWVIAQGRKLLTKIRKLLARKKNRVSPSSPTDQLATTA